jgi:hypothetical protein
LTNPPVFRIRLSGAYILARFRTYSAQFGFGSPKSATSTRTMVVTPELARILSEHRACKKGKPDDIMFSNREGRFIRYIT